MGDAIFPYFFVTGIQKDSSYVTLRAFIKPRVFAASVANKSAFIRPRVFTTAFDLSETATADTLRRVTNSAWTGSETAVADTLRRVLDVARADTLRVVTSPESARADTLIRRLHELRYVVQSTPKLKMATKLAAATSSLVNSFKDYGVTALEFTLNERTLSDSFTLETARAMNINDAVRGQLLDYPFSFLVEETSQRDLIQTVRGMYDVDKLLYSHVYESGTAENSETLKASAYVSKIANYFSLTPNVKIQNFTPSNDLSDSNITYSDLIGTLFGWTSQLPQRQVNVFIRGDTLHCIQRGLENSVIDIDGWSHSRPTINRKLLRTMYKNANAAITDNSEEDEIERPFSGTISYSDAYSSNVIRYDNGLLTSERFATTNNKVASVIETAYEYTSRQGSSSDEAVHYLAAKTSTSTTIENEDIEEIGLGTPSGDNLIRTVVTSDIRYVYANSGDGVYLVKEYETERKETYSRSGGTYIWELDETEANDRQTTHTPAGNGWYATSVYLNGVHQGSSLSQGKPSNEISLYTVSQVGKRFSRTNETPAALTPIDTTSFPIVEAEILKELAEALQWLNRKIQETVSVEILDEIVNGVPKIQHIVDFTERVKFGGQEYFLVSNQVRFTPRSLIQKLQLVRWY